MKSDRMSPLARFERKYAPEPNSGCWLWTGSVRARYGCFRFQDEAQAAHRASWQLFRGPIPAGLFVLHRCDTPLCVNPDHLFLGTQTDNMADMAAKGRKVIGRAGRHGNHARGAGNGGARATAETVAAMRRTWEGGIRNQAAIARKFGMSETQTRRILAGDNWRAG